MTVSLKNVFFFKSQDDDETLDESVMEYEEDDE